MSVGYAVGTYEVFRLRITLRLSPTTETSSQKHNLEMTSILYDINRENDIKHSRKRVKQEMDD